MVDEHLSFLWVANIGVWMVVLHIASCLLWRGITLSRRFLSICSGWVLIGIWKLHFTIRLVEVSTRFRLLLAYEWKQEVICVIWSLTQILLLQVETFNLLALTSLVYIIFIDDLWWHVYLIHWFPEELSDLVICDPDKLITCSVLRFWRANIVYCLDFTTLSERRQVDIPSSMHWIFVLYWHLRLHILLSWIPLIVTDLLDMAQTFIVFLLKYLLLTLL